EILRGKRAVESRLHHQHDGIEGVATWGWLSKKRERNNQRCEQDDFFFKQKTAYEIFSVDRRNPNMTLDELQAGRSRIELSPQSEGTCRGAGIKYQSDGAAIPLRPSKNRQRSEERDQNNRCNQANHA